jgi:peptide/nickel transport system substrate-binding protein
MKKLFLVSFVICFLLPGILWGAPSGKLVIAQGNELTSLDPTKHGTMNEMNYNNAVFDKLYLFDAQGNAVPRLAVSHQLINETTWEFKLRKGVKFHNGDSFTAADVKFSIERYLDPKSKSPHATFLKSIKEVKVIDDYTIQVVTEKPDPLLPKRFAHTNYIFPSKYIKEKGEESFLRSAIGSGPFKFVEWVRGDRLVLEANEGYWAGPPFIKTVIFRAIPEDTTRMAELQTGMVDIAVQIPPFMVDQMKKLPEIEVQSVPGAKVAVFSINTVAPGPLQDRRVRQALNYAVDKKAIIERILLGSGFQTAINLTSHSFGFDPNLKPYPYDPEKAKKLLAEAGYKNLKLVLNSPNGRYMFDKQVCEAVAGMWEKVGISVDFRVREWGDYVKGLLSKKLVDVGMIQNFLTMYDADGILSLYFTKDSAYSYFSDPDLENWLPEARYQLDEKKRKDLYIKIQKKLYDEAAMVFLYQPLDHWGVSKKVKGFQAGPDDIFYLHKVSVEK